MEGENNNSIVEIKKITDSATQKGGKLIDRGNYGRATSPKNSSVWVKGGVTVKRTPGRAEGFFGQIPMARPAHKTRPDADTNAIMAEKNTTREREKGVRRYILL